MKFKEMLRPTPQRYSREKKAPVKPEVGHYEQ